MSQKNKEENKIQLTANINEVFATTELIQYFKNPLDNPIELNVQFPIKENINLSKFEITMNDKKVISKILSKEKADEEYSDAIAQGNTAIKSEYSKSLKFYNINIGNINPKESICLKTIYNQSIQSYDMSYEYVIMKDFPSFVLKKDDEDEDDDDDENEKNKIEPEIIINININSFSKITRLITNFKEKENLKISYNNDFSNAKIDYKINKNNINNKYSIDLHILFRTKEMNKPNLFYQYNPTVKKPSYSLNFLYLSENIEKLIEDKEKPDENDRICYYNKYQNNLINNDRPIYFFSRSKWFNEGDTYKISYKSFINIYSIFTKKFIFSNYRLWFKI